MGQDSILGRLVEQYHVQYDRVFFNVYAVLFLGLGIVGKDILSGGKSPADILKAGTPVSWYILCAVLFLASFLVWYTYSSWLLYVASSLLVENDELYRKFLTHPLVNKASALTVILTNIPLFLLPLLAIIYYNFYELGFGYEFSWFALTARLCFLYFMLVVLARMIALLKIRKGLIRIAESPDKVKTDACQPSTIGVNKKHADNEPLQPIAIDPALAELYVDLSIGGMNES